MFHIPAKPQPPDNQNINKGNMGSNFEKETSHGGGRRFESGRAHLFLLDLEKKNAAAVFFIKREQNDYHKEIKSRILQLLI